MIRRPPRSTPLYSSAASDVYKRQEQHVIGVAPEPDALSQGAGSAAAAAAAAVSYTHLRAHETKANLVCRLLLEKNKGTSKHYSPYRSCSLPCTLPWRLFFNDTATTEIYTSLFVGSVRCV